MDLKIGDIQETALITLAIRASETDRPNTEFQWGTKSGKEYLDLEPRLTLLSEQSYNVEMRKYSVRAMLFAFFLPFLNNRLAVYQW